MAVLMTSFSCVNQSNFTLTEIHRSPQSFSFVASRRFISASHYEYRKMACACWVFRCLWEYLYGFWTNRCRLCAQKFCPSKSNFHHPIRSQWIKSNSSLVEYPVPLRNMPHSESQMCSEWCFMLTFKAWSWKQCPCDLDQPLQRHTSFKGTTLQTGLACSLPLNY